MPTSNGQVSRYDIRRGAVVETGLADDVISTAKIQDLAVAFPDKIDLPIWTVSFGNLLFHNETLTTTPTAFGSVTVDVPTWVNNVSVYATMVVQISATGAALYSAGIEIDGEVQGGHSVTVPASSTGILVSVRSANLAGVAGSSFTVTLEASVSSGTNSSNHGSVAGIAVGTR